MEGDSCRGCEASVVSSVEQVSETPRRRLGGRATRSSGTRWGAARGAEGWPGCVEVLAKSDCASVTGLVCILAKLTVRAEECGSCQGDPQLATESSAGT